MWHHLAEEYRGLSHLPFNLQGHSFEARIYAEDPAAGFLPSGGRWAAVLACMLARVEAAHVAVDACSHATCRSSH